VEAHFGRLEDLIELFEDEGWRHAMFGGNRWSAIAREIRDLRDALDGGALADDKQVAIAAMSHNTGRVGDKLQSLDSALQS
jgi:hypothetical protein